MNAACEENPLMCLFGLRGHKVCHPCARWHLARYCTVLIMCAKAQATPPPQDTFICCVHFDSVLIISVHLVEFNPFMTKLILFGNLQYMAAWKRSGSWHASRLVKYSCKQDICIRPVMKGLKFAHLIFCKVSTFL